MGPICSSPLSGKENNGPRLLHPSTLMRLLTAAVGPMTDGERRVALLIGALSHVAGLPAVVAVFKRGRAFETVLGVAVLTTSFMYHTCELQRTPLLGMTAGNWHRLDNIFICFGLVSTCLFLMGTISRFVDDALRWTFLVVVLWCQERGPWRTEHMLAPIALAFLLLLGTHLYNRRVPSWFLGHHAFWKGLGFIALGSYFFAVGLDDARDYLRLNHFLWHLFAGFAAYYFAIIPSGRLSELSKSE
eukprot:TRINITY_DN16857_c0_g1_i1.p1 TRINITY_DN16857_c0_g1~~TRINITY_DN16857_c0_g1_i1.p1  ORF type:complete len:245 (+),score=72.38 TRINITY_DN16857_c0_g1_i1:84-818(+)